MSATVDEIGNVTIQNYPSEWTGKLTLKRFDGQSGDKTPFSKGHCERLKTMIDYGQGLLVRTAYHSLLSFETPAFLSYDFMEAIRDSAKNAEIELSAFELLNRVDIRDGTLDLELDEFAISRLIGDIMPLKEQLNLARKGNEKGPFEKDVIVNSGDILCDLAHGNARITMNYPIKSQKRYIKVIYDRMEVHLE